MRVYLLPISTRQALVYCQRISTKPVAQLSYADRIQKKATDTWAGWESAERGWKKKVVEYGNYALQRIPYQEWGLKSFPPSNPDLQAEQLTAGKKFDIVFPSNMMQKEDVPKVLARLASERKQLHHKRWIGSMIALPLTIPFALIPMYVMNLYPSIESVCLHPQYSKYSILLHGISRLVTLERLVYMTAVPR